MHEPSRRSAVQVQTATETRDRSHCRVSVVLSASLILEPALQTRIPPFCSLVVATDRECKFRLPRRSRRLDMNWGAIFRGDCRVILNHSLSISFEFSKSTSFPLSRCTQGHAICVSIGAPLHVSISSGRRFPYNRIEL